MVCRKIFGGKLKFMIHALTGVGDDFLVDGGFASIPPGDRRGFCRGSFPAPVIYL
jgi:hypothetical protein